MNLNFINSSAYCISVIIEGEELLLLPYKNKNFSVKSDCVHCSIALKEKSLANCIFNIPYKFNFVVRTNLTLKNISENDTVELFAVEANDGGKANYIFADARLKGNATVSIENYSVNDRDEIYTSIMKKVKVNRFIKYGLLALAIIITLFEIIAPLMLTYFSAKLNNIDIKVILFVFLLIIVLVLGVVSLTKFVFSRLEKKLNIQNDDFSNIEKKSKHKK